MASNEKVQIPSNVTGTMINTSTAPNNKISADNIIPTTTRQFITYEEKEVLSGMLDALTGTSKHVMYKENYDRDNDSLIDVAKKALTADLVLWENILGRPEVNTQDLTQAIENEHKHDNQEILDKIDIDSSGNLIYDNHEFNLPDTLMHVYDYDVDRDGVIDKALYADSTNWENILNKPLFYMPSPHHHKSTDIDGDINATYLNGVNGEEYLKKNDPIEASRLIGLDNFKLTIRKIYGGNSISEFDGNSDEDETQIIPRFDNQSSMNIINPVLGEMEIAYETETYRHKMGDGIDNWNLLPYEYNTPGSIRFNTKSRKYLSYYDREEYAPVDTSIISTMLLAVANNVLYSGMVRAYNDTLVAVPYNATEIFMTDSDGANHFTFGTSLGALNANGSGWYGGVATVDGSYVYCAPYNADKILKIDTRNKSIDTITNTIYVTSKKAKFMKGCRSSNGLIYFAPHNSDGILELDPVTDIVKFYQNSSIFDTDQNCCDIIHNHVDDMLYLIPKKNNRIIRFDPYSKSMSIVAECNDHGISKFASAVMATNGLIYCIPSYGYDNMMIFDPNTYSISYVEFMTSAYDIYNGAVVAPNGNIYIMPAGITAKYVIELNVNNNTTKQVYMCEGVSERYCDGIMNSKGQIICFPYSDNKVLVIDTKVKSNIPSDYILR